MAEKISYEKAYAELQEIIRKVEEDQPGIDELTQLMKRAATLIASCKSKLRETETELLQAFDEPKSDENNS